MASGSILGWAALVTSVVACGDQLTVEPSLALPSLERVDSGVPASTDPEDDAATTPTEGTDGAVPVASDAGVVGSDAAVADAQVGDAGNVAQPDPSSDAAVAHVLPDGAVSTKPAQGPDGGSLGCTTMYYRDGDGDGFGDANSYVLSCSLPSGYVADATDCYDKNAAAKPGQSARFSVHRGDGSFDYDCDGVEKSMSSKLASCPDLTGALCLPPSASLLPGVPVPTCDFEAQQQSWQWQIQGWYQQVPACGVSGLQNLAMVWNSSATLVACSAPLASSARIQQCR